MNIIRKKSKLDFVSINKNIPATARLYRVVYPPRWCELSARTLLAVRIFANFYSLKKNEKFYICINES